MDRREVHRPSDEIPFLSDDDKENFASVKQTPRVKRLTHALIYSMILNIALLLILTTSWVLRGYTKKAYIPNEIYSPAQEAVEYETVIFSGGLREEKSKFRGSSSDVDAEWDEMYNDVLISQINAETAAKLPNATTPFTNDTNHYIVELDVFHQLHCLNMLRKLVYPAVYEMDLTSGSEKAVDNIFHMEHCYEQLRQSLQCSSDISTIYWQWSKKKRRMFGNVRTTHTCRNFGKIRDWAVKNKAQTELDFYQYVEGAPLLEE